MRIAVVGSGIAGLASAWLLARAHEVVLFEQSDRLGGHTHTHDVVLGGRDYRVDTGFIVFNPPNYPLLGRMFDELGVASKPTTMSFSVQDARNGLEYNATSLFSKQGVVFTTTYMHARMKFRATLTNNNFTCLNNLTAVTLNTKVFRP